jgi:hypothetical protein
MSITRKKDHSRKRMSHASGKGLSDLEMDYLILISFAGM